MIDLYSRKVIGGAMSERMTEDLACDALQMPCGSVSGHAASLSTVIAAASIAPAPTNR